MSVLLVVHNIHIRGGMEVQVAHLADGLAASGHRVRLASIRSTAGGPAPPLDRRVEVIHLGAHGRLAGIASLRRLARLARTSDLVHCTGWDASLWGRLSAIMARRPVVVSEHSPGREHQVSSTGTPRGRWIGWHNRLLDRYTDVTIICAEWQRAMLQREGVAARKLICVPNGVPVEALRDRVRVGATREQLEIPAGAKVVVLCARFVPQKRQLLALETTARLREELGDIRIVFAGEGPELGRVREAADARGADWATFVGRHENVPSLFALADLAVLPSWGEAMPMAIVEAIAVGTPVVATEVGDVGRLLERTGAGIPVPVDDADAFYRSCRQVLADAAVRERLATAALGAADQIDALTMVRRYERIFDAVVCDAIDPVELSRVAGSVA
jgi:glycosyltransferase involved in cell wall biosynthesis